MKKKDMEKAEKAVKDADADAVRDNEYNKFIKEQQEKGKPLPPGETLKKDAEALKEAESKKPAAETAAPHKEAEAKPADASKPAEQPKKDK